MCLQVLKNNMLQLENITSDKVHFEYSEIIEQTWAYTRKVHQYWNIMMKFGNSFYLKGKIIIPLHIIWNVHRFALSISISSKTTISRISVNKATLQ